MNNDNFKRLEKASKESAASIDGLKRILEDVGSNIKKTENKPKSKFHR